MHTQGRRSVIVTINPNMGTIHAHAGQTSIGDSRCYILRNHPCTRGADDLVVRTASSYAEPSMHTRGRPFAVEPDGASLGTIHAHAGQTRCVTSWICAGWNHPCTRGADEMRDFLDMRGLEPSMHTRGRHVYAGYFYVA